MLDGFEDDDLQHLHAAWMVSRGAVPYRDYFDHHAPFFHILFAPLTTLVRDPLTLLLVTRGVALIFAISIFYLFWRLAPPELGRAGGWLALLMLASARHTDLLFELRPDYCALAAILFATATHIRARPGIASGFAAGGMVGIALILTQKAAALAPAFVIYQALRVIHRRAHPDYHPHLAMMGGLIAGMVLPPLILILGLRGVGALEGFLAGPIGFASHWVQPEDWTLYTQEPVLIGFPLFVLGYAWATRSVARLLAAEGDERWRGDGLLGLMALIGTAAFLKTPAPTQQAYAVTMHLWVLACAVRHLTALLLPGGAALRGEKLWRGALGAGAAGSLLLLKLHNIAVALALAALLGLIWRVTIRRSGGRIARAPAAFLLCAAVPTLVAVGTAGDRVLRGFAFSQIASMRVVDSRIPPGGRALTTWPVYTPLRPHASFHWFSDPGMYTSMPLEKLRAEYLAALEDSRTAVVVCQPAVIGKWLPEVWERIERDFVEISLPGLGLRRARAFERRGTAGIRGGARPAIRLER